MVNVRRPGNERGGRGVRDDETAKGTATSAVVSLNIHDGRLKRFKSLRGVRVRI